MCVFGCDDDRAELRKFFDVSICTNQYLHLALTLVVKLNPHIHISCSENSVDPDQLASQTEWKTV